jgi:hypothetical protein
MARMSETPSAIGKKRDLFIMNGRQAEVQHFE